MAVAGVQIYIGCKVFRDLQSDTAVPTLESPSGGQRRTSGRPNFNPAIASMQFKRLKPAMGPNMSIAGSGTQLTFNPIDLLRAISAAQIHVALEAVHVDLAIAGMQIDAAFARHMDIDVHMMAANFEVELVMSSLVSSTQAPHQSAPAFVYARRISLLSAKATYSRAAVAAKAAPIPIFCISRNGATAHNTSSAKISGNMCRNFSPRRR